MDNKDNIFDKIGDFFENIGEWIKNLFDAMEREWDKLDPKIQEALKKGSGIVDVINKNLDAAPDFVWELIRQKFPDVTEEKVKDILSKAGKYFKTADDIEDPDLLTMIKNGQVYLSTLEGKFWEGASSTMAELIAIGFAPDTTAFAKISMFAEYVYRKYIKGGDRPPKPPKNP